MISREVTLLFVEDDISVQRVMLGFLEMLPFSSVYVASNGKEALEQFYLHEPDIILTDLRMPIMDGIELAEKVKSFYPELPIILITAQFEKEVTERAVDIGIDAYLFKPVSLERLEKSLVKYKELIIQRRVAENQNRLLEEYKNAIDVSAAVTKTDINGVITYVNNIFCDMTGYSKEELIGHNHNMVKHSETSREFYRDLWNTIKSKNIWKGKLKNCRKDGSTYYESSVIIPILNSENIIVEFIAIRQDITDLYNQEQYLKKRVIEEVNKNLLDTKYAVIGRMAAGITHEINTPLTYIRGNTELMIEDIKNIEGEHKQKEYLLEDAKVILDGTNRIGNIIESMREMFSSSKEELECYNIYATLITALTLSFSKSKHMAQIQLQGQAFTVGMPNDRFIYDAMVQKQRVEQVWIIIINNAIDALKNVEGYDNRVLEIGIENENDYIVVRFKDNGEGIDETILDKIFDPFESTKTDGGMGIGLNVAKRIVDEHKGEIVASNYEEGALFEVYLPKCFKKN